MSEDGWKREGPAYDSPKQRRARHRRQGVARGEELTHSGLFDGAAVVVLVVALVRADESLGGADHQVTYLLTVALVIFAIRAFVRLCAFFKDS